jgi:hypothetical protein
LFILSQCDTVYNQFSLKQRWKFIPAMAGPLLLHFNQAGCCRKPLFHAAGHSCDDGFIPVYSVCQIFPDWFNSSKKAVYCPGCFPYSGTIEDFA